MALSTGFCGGLHDTQMDDLFVLFWCDYYKLWKRGLGHLYFWAISPNSNFNLEIKVRCNSGIKIGIQIFFLKSKLLLLRKLRSQNSEENVQNSEIEIRILRIKSKSFEKDKILKEI